MVDHASTSIPRPKNWQDFERCCRILFECILGDPHTQLNGRSGQPQHGVDVFGRRGGEGGPWVGVQCKGREEAYGGSVTETELRREVDKASRFTPAIGEFILVTTAPDDARIQEVARLVTQERFDAGHPLSVAVWGWGHLESHISEHARALRAFSPDAGPLADQMLAGLGRIEEGRLADRELLEEILVNVRSSPAMADPSDGSTAALEILDKHLHAQIDEYRDLINEGKPETALRLLDKLRERTWDSAANRVRFRLLTNFGAAKLKLRDEAGAAEAFLAAIEYDPTDRIGMANVALAYLIQRNRDMAVKAAQQALQRDPTNSNAASYLIQAQIEDPSIDDPFELVPEDLKDAAPVRLAAIWFYRDRGSVEWRKAAREAALLLPDNEMCRRFAAEADLDEVLATKNPLLGAEIPMSDGSSRLEQATESLSQSWEKARQSEVTSVDLALPQNLAQAYLVRGDEESAARVVDEALGIAPTHAGLRLLRAKVHMLCDEAAATLKILNSELQEPEALLLRVLALLRLQRSGDALVTIDALLEQPLDEDTTLKASLLRMEVLQEGRRFDEAYEAVRCFLDEYPDNIRGLCMLSELYRSRGEEQPAHETLSSACRHVRETTSLEDRLTLADAWTKSGESEHACELLEGLIDTTRDSVGLRTWLRALSDADRRARARQVFDSLPPCVAGMPFYLRAYAELQLRMQDLTAALATVERYVQLRPTDLELHLVLVSILLRRNAEEKVQQLLQDEHKIEGLQGSPERRLELAHLLRRFGFAKRAFQLAYATLLQHGDNPQVHLRFVGLAMSREDVEGIPLDIVQVSIDTVFTAENVRGERADYLITNDDVGPPGVILLTPDDDLARAALGHAAAGYGPASARGMAHLLHQA